MDLSTKDKSRKRKTSREDPIPTRTRLEVASERPLTFRPAFDDKKKLTAFLKGVFDKHMIQRRRLLEVEESAQSKARVPTYPESAARMPSSRSDEPLENTQATTHRPRASKTSATSTRRTVAQLPTRSGIVAKASADSKPPPSKAQPKPRRRSRAGNNASLLRAKSIDFNAPDPEEEAPPNETEDERRRRKERINGRRKRAKKMIEIDYLQEQYHTLKQQNDKLKDDNKTLREKIAMIRDLEQSGLIQLRPPEAASRHVSTGRLKQAEAPSVSQQGLKPPSSDTRVPLIQYAIPPAASLALRVNQDLTPRRQHEESKESMVQPQYVGLERLAPAALQGTGNLGVPALPSIPILPRESFANPFFSPFAQTQQHMLPQSSMPSMLLQQQQQSMITQNVQALAEAQPPPSPMQQIYQQLLNAQQQQQQQQRQGQQQLQQPQQLQAGFQAQLQPPSQQGPQYHQNQGQPPQR